ncbi:MAG: radical SAM protein, partial [Endomicrobiia bacterium]
FTLITKSNLVLRDIDLLEKINTKAKCVIQMTLTTYDENLCKKLEPNVSTTKERFEVLKKMRDAGIPTVVWLCPILPFINDTKENISKILDYCIEAKVYGVICFGIGLTLREGNREYFYNQLDRLFPGMKEKYIEVYGNQYIINSNNNNELMNLFHKKCEMNGIIHDNTKIFKYLSSFNEKQLNKQLVLFD